MTKRSFTALFLLVLAACSTSAESKDDSSVSTMRQRLCTGDTCWDCEDVASDDGTTTRCETPCSEPDSSDVYTCGDEGEGDAKCPPPKATKHPKKAKKHGKGGSSDGAKEGKGGDGTGGDADDADDSKTGKGGAATGGDGTAGGDDSDSDTGGPFKCKVANGKRSCESKPTSCACTDTDTGPGGSAGGGKPGAGTSPAAGGQCTLTQGYWKNHASAWPVQSLTIGGVSYSKEQLLEIFRTPPAGDVSHNLAHQLIAAMLNAASGDSTAQIGGTITEAQAWMTKQKDADGRLPYGVSDACSCAAGTSATDLSSKLDAYNNGKLGVPHCG
jgi:hypothetical protein